MVSEDVRYHYGDDLIDEEKIIIPVVAYGKTSSSLNLYFIAGLKAIRTSCKKLRRIILKLRALAHKHNIFQLW